MKWYNTLNKDGTSLLSNVKVKDGNIIVCWQQKFRKFGLFKGYNELRNFINETEGEKRTFYEIIFGTSPRKIYFDIDITQDEAEFENSDKFIKKIKKNIISLIKDDELTVMIYTSHTEKKKSYHIVVDGYFLKNNLESKEFFNKLYDLYPTSLLDSSVYSSLQQFRLLGSHKYEKNNVKVLSFELSENIKIPKDERMVKPYIFLRSLVANIDDCKYLKGFKPPTPPPLERGFCEEGDMTNVLNILDITYPKTFDVYKTLFDDGNLLITLKKTEPYKCMICERYHESENAYVVVRGEAREVFFDCRRRGDKPMQYLGDLEQKDFKFKDKEEEKGRFLALKEFSSKTIVKFEDFDRFRK